MKLLSVLGFMNIKEMMVFDKIYYTFFDVDILKIVQPEVIINIGYHQYCYFRWKKFFI